MMRLWISLHAVLALIPIVTVTYADADTYTWTDEQQTVHCTDDPGLVPEKFRKNIRKLDDDISSQPTSAASLPDENREDMPMSDRSADQKTFNGKSYDQWEKELADRVTAMAAIRKRLDENADQLRSCGPDWQVQEKLFAERKALTAQFKEMKAQYFQQVEIARKAGLKIDIKE